jgi:hypothetical protein
MKSFFLFYYLKIRNFLFYLSFFNLNIFPKALHIFFQYFLEIEFWFLVIFKLTHISVQVIEVADELSRLN